MSGSVARPVPVSTDTPAPVEPVRGPTAPGRGGWGGRSVALALAATALLVIPAVPDSVARLVAMAAVAGAAAAVALAVRRTRVVERGAAARAEETDRARQAVLVSEQRYAALAESIPQLVWVARSDGGLLDANYRWAAYTGVAWEDSLGLTWKDVVHKDDLTAALAGWADATRSGAAYAAEVRLRRYDGKYRWHINRAVPVRDSAGGAVRWYGTSTDVEDRKRAEAALRDRKAFLQAILAHIPAGVFWKNRDLTYLGCNDRVARDCGLSSPRELVGKTDYDLPYRPVQAEFYRSCDRKVLETGQPLFDVEEEQTRADGSTAILLTSKVPLRDAAGAVVGVLGVYRDVTERRRLEDQLRHAQKMEAVGRLAGGVAHDFNNLLTVIQGNADLLHTPRPGAPAPGELLDDVRTAADRAAGLVRQLLVFSRRQPSRPEVVDLNAVVADMAGMLRRVLGERVTVATWPDPRPVTVLIDRGHAEQVVMNLAVNARDAMPGGGTLTIRTEAVAGGRSARLTVSDTGTGMTAAVQARIFEPFFTTKGPDKGTGLGLATVYGIVERAGGRIEVDSAPGAGATFRIEFPGCPAPARPAGEAGPADAGPAGPAGGGRAVLLVEDEDGVRKFARFALEASGYAVTEAASAEAALTLLAPDRPLDLLVTDLTMPGMDGRELAGRVRAVRPGVGVVFASGYVPEDDHFGGVTGAVFLPKPYTPAALLRAAGEALPRVGTREWVAG